MRTLILILLSVTILSCSANKEAINANKNGYIADGYDVTEYFNGNAVMGKSAFTTGYNGAWYKFVSEENKQKFEANPEMYEPQYGGYCAYAVGEDAKKIDINPESYIVENNKLYLFYDNVLADTKKKWKESNTEELKRKADANWPKIKMPANSIKKAQRERAREQRIAERKARKAKRKNNK